MNTRIQNAKKRFHRLSLYELLEEISVLSPGVWENCSSASLNGWYAVADYEGIIAYFSTEEEAFHYRLDYINRILNS